MTLNEENIMNQHTLRSTLSVIGVVIGFAILNAPAWSADTARKGAPKSQRGAVKFDDIAVAKGERQQPGDTPAGQLLSTNKHPEGISWSGSDGDERQKSPTKGQASGSPTGQNVTGGTIPVYSDKTVPNKLGNFEIQGIVSPRDSASGLPSGQNATGGTIPVYFDKSKPTAPGAAPTAGIMACNGGPCFNPADTARGTPQSAQSASGIISPRDPQSGLPTGIVSPRDQASGQATGK
jgi:hypothetical protein